MTDRPTVVFGLDGAHFELIEPWLDAGRLPNVQRAIDEGVSGDLRSVLPPVTSPNWKAYATGKNPGKLGIFWWENVDTDGRRVYYPSERKHTNDEFWELLGEDTVGVVGVPTTYPPKSVDGFLVAGAPDGHNTGYATPASVEPLLDEHFDYRVRKRYRLDGDRERAVMEILDLIDSRFAAAAALAEEYDPDFLQITTFYLNSLQHYLWDDDATRRGWERIDDHLGTYLDGDYDVVLMSDHGSHPIRTVFHVNTWLEREGYLVTDDGVASAAHRLGLNKTRLVRLTNRLGVTEAVKRLTPERVLRYLPDEQGSVNKEGKSDIVDWDATDALASGQGPVYLTADPDAPAYEPLREELIAALESLTDPAGRPIASAVHRGEAVYDGPYLEEAPDLVIEQARGVHIPGGIGRDDVFTEPTADGWRAENKRDGLFVATGPSFGTGDVENFSILDLAPTLLHLRGRPVPADMDGEVRRDVFAPETTPATASVSYRERDPRARERERIRAVARDLEL